LKKKEKGVGTLFYASGSAAAFADEGERRKKEDEISEGEEKGKKKEASVDMW